MVTIVNHFVLPGPSTTSELGVHLDFYGGVLRLLFDYERDDKLYNSGLLFKKVRGIIHTADYHCPAWKIEKAYDHLVEIANSEVVDELSKGITEDHRSYWKLNHYMIFFDGSGCFEIIADSWSSLPEELGILIKSVPEI